MRLHLEGNINTYYVQTLCMIFFPGSKFSEDQENDPNAPMLDLRLEETADACAAHAVMSYAGREVSATASFPFRADITKERTTDEHEELLKRVGESISELERLSYKTLHARSAVAEIKEKYPETSTVDA